MGVLSGLKPSDVFENFELLCSVPHGSGNTKKISDLIAGFAKEKGLRFMQDSHNNVVIYKDAAKGYENAEPVILQGHIDMVCAKAAGCEKDMAKEGLDLMTDGEAVWADKTSLGADNCIAAAMIMAILADKEAKHPALEAVFTTDEETGMFGAKGLDKSLLKGRRMINMDSEEEGVFTVCCSGGGSADCFIPVTWEPCYENDAFIKVNINGLLGGHSGCDIEKGRANANKLMGRVLYTVNSETAPVRLVSMSGGVVTNAITPCSEAVIAVSSCDKEKVLKAFAAAQEMLTNEFMASDPGLCIKACETENTGKAVCAAGTDHILYCIMMIPQGLQVMSREFPGIPQTSLNLGIMRLKEEGFSFIYSIRSSKHSQLHMVSEKIRACVLREGGTVDAQDEYPSWEYRKDSRLRDLMSRVYRELNGKDAECAATHGGLECAIFVSEIPGLDCVAIGPDLYDIHSEYEKLSVKSTEKVFSLVKEVLRQCI